MHPRARTERSQPQREPRDSIPIKRVRAAAWLAALACLATGEIGEASAQATEFPIRRVRSMERTIRAALQEGYRRSPTFQQVLVRLDESTVVVYVVSGFCEVTRLDGCLLGHVTNAGNSRYLRIVVNPHTPTIELIGRIGHELQHALEVAGAPEVVDAASMKALFRRIASTTCRGVLVDCYETRAAVEVEERVLAELSSGP